MYTLYSCTEIAQAYEVVTFLAATEIYSTNDAHLSSPSISRLTFDINSQSDHLY